MNITTSRSRWPRRTFRSPRQPPSFRRCRGSYSLAGILVATLGVAAVWLAGRSPVHANPLSFDNLRSRNGSLFSSWSQTPHPAIVRVVAEERIGVSNGSGTLVDVRGDYGLVVTNWHVIRDAVGEISVQFPDGFRSSARILKVDKDWDLAALIVLKPRAAPVRIATAPPRPGELLTIAGYGKGDYRAASGKCMQYVAPGTRHPYEMIEVSVQARNGDSGGPILNERGELAGVLFGAGNGTTSGSFCGRVRWFLESAWPAIGQELEPPAQASPSVVAASSPLPAVNANSETSRPLVPVEAADRGATTIDANSSYSQFASQRVISEVESGLPSLDPAETFPRQIPYYSAPPERDPPSGPASRSNSELPQQLKDLIGDSPLEQGKLLLAIVGCLALLSRFVGARGGG